MTVVSCLNVFELVNVVEQCLRSCGSEFQMWGPKLEKVGKPRVLRLY